MGVALGSQGVSLRLRLQRGVFQFSVPLLLSSRFSPAAAVTRRALRTMTCSEVFGYSLGSLAAGAIFDLGGWVACAVLQMAVASAQAAPQEASPSHAIRGFSLLLSRGAWTSSSSSDCFMIPCCNPILMAS